jgi:hypothetical protein
VSRIKTYDFDLIRGDDFQKVLTFKDSSGELLDVSSWAFTGQVRADPDSTSPSASFAFDVTDAADGVVTATVDADQTAELVNRFYYYDLQRDDGETTLTFIRGRLNLIKDVTRAEEP